MDISQLIQVGQAGGTVILMVILFALWGEFREQNKFIREMLTQAEAERKVIAQQVGLDTQNLKAEAEIIKWRQRQEKK